MPKYLRSTNDRRGGRRPDRRVEAGGGCRIKWRVALIEDKCEKIKTHQQQIFFLLQQPQSVCVEACSSLQSLLEGSAECL